MAVIHISEADAARDFAALMRHIRAGEEVIIESNSTPLAVLRPAEAKGRLLSEAIALAQAHAKELGYSPAMDPDFADDLEEIVRNRKPRTLYAWE
jgi:antitoxin (DNA-binding transcriptional repressor) of toxin-antitoxin stability system